MLNSVVIIQPPLVQLNGPYPSGAYLSAFFRNPGGDSAAPRFVRWIDAGNRFFRELFSASGLTRLFSLCRGEALSKADVAARAGDAETAYQLRRYVSLEKAWIEWIDGVVSILCTGDRERCHSFVRSPFAPRGARMDSFLAALGTEPTPDDGRMLATLAIEDLADFITTAFDPEFSLVRYAESIAAGERHFANIEAALDRPIVARFVEPLCDELWRELDESLPVSGFPGAGADRILFCLSVPFPGCLVNALAMARSIRRHFGDRAIISMGGGYVNTELRSCLNDRLFEYIDSLSFDRGYGGYAWLLRASAPVPRHLFCPPELFLYEKEMTGSIVPDYSDIDFSLYPRLADDPNPMHRLWSDGTWLKAYLAHGCYWHRCSFCDVSLDYIGEYLPVGTANLYRGLRKQALEKRVYGIHLVDEAAPPRALRDFALENIKASRLALFGPSLLPFWGNIRFERTFSRDLADFLSAGGLVAVSGGIEIASPEGFRSVDKGIDLENLVAVCAAFKEAGILVHSYLIYGYWNEDAQGVIDAAEVMRQLFSAGLVDSAFWHKFVLTKHSRVYCEYREGLHHGKGESSGSGDALQPVEEPGDFAENDLRFKGEKESERYTSALDAALAAWMTGEGLEKPVRSWFSFSMPAPRIPKDLIETYIASYEQKRDHERNRSCESDAEYYWTAGAPVRVEGELMWWHFGEEVRLPVDDELAVSISAALFRADTPGAVLADTGALSGLPRSVFKALRRHGLCKISPL